MREMIDGMICWDLPEGHPWEPFLRPLVEQLEAAGYDVVQVKDKFGYPRVYFEMDGAMTHEGALPPDLKAAWDAAFAACKPLR